MTPNQDIVLNEILRFINDDDLSPPLFPKPKGIFTPMTRGEDVIQARTVQHTQAQVCVLSGINMLMIRSLGAKSEDTAVAIRANLTDITARIKRKWPTMLRVPHSESLDDEEKQRRARNLCKTRMTYRLEFFEAVEECASTFLHALAE